MRLLLLVILLGLTRQQAIAQSGVVNWTFTVEKTDDQTFNLHFRARPYFGWHIYAQSSPAGGPIPTRFVFKTNPLLQFDGIPQESGRLVSKYEEVFDITVKYFDGAVDFIQTVKRKNSVKTNLTGSIEFMACNDKQCLAPTSIPFNLALE